MQLGVWEQPANWPREKAWKVPVAEVLAAVDDAFRRHNVVGFYADPAKWESHIASWEAKYGTKLKVKATREHPIEWWMTGGRASIVVKALAAFHDAVIDKELSHDGSSELTRHALAAVRRESRSGIQIAKEHPDSERKIDALPAAVLAFTCAIDAVAKGEAKRRPRRIVRRVR